MPRSGGRAFADLEAIVWEADPVARVFTAVTGAAAELTGHAPGVWTAAPDFAAALIYPEDRGDALAAFDEAIVSAERRHVEYRVVTADGRVVWLHNAVQPATRRRRGPAWGHARRHRAEAGRAAAHGPILGDHGPGGRLQPRGRGPGRDRGSVRLPRIAAGRAVAGGR